MVFIINIPAGHVSPEWLSESIKKNVVQSDPLLHRGNLESKGRACSLWLSPRIKGIRGRRANQIYKDAVVELDLKPNVQKGLDPEPWHEQLAVRTTRFPALELGGCIILFHAKPIGSIWRCVWSVMHGQG